MKRLIKKSEYDIVDFIKRWFANDGAPNENEIDTVMRDNPDCVYNRDAYRFIQIDIGEIDPDNITEDDIREIKSKIRVNDFYKSWAKSDYGAEQFVDNVCAPGSTGVILEANVKGLDFEKLFNKYKNKFDQEDASYYQEGVDNEEEVIAPTPSNYEIYEIYYDGDFIELF